MNYKLRNLIGVVSFILILVFMINSNLILSTINLKIIGKEFVGIKDDKLVLSKIENTNMTFEDLHSYILNNLKEIDFSKNEDYKFSILTKDIKKEDEYIERFKINIDENFSDSLLKHIKEFKTNESMFMRFSLYSGDKVYLSDILNLSLISLESLDETKSYVLSDFTSKGTKVYVKVPEDISLNEKNNITITGVHDKSEILSLNAYYDKKDNNIIIENLVPSKSYTNISMVTKDSNGYTLNFLINKILTESETELEDYIVKIYLQVLKRYPREKEYSHMIYNLSNGKVTLNEVLIDFLVSEEFSLTNETPKKIIESIYYLTNKKTINSRLSVLILDEFNDKLLNSSNINEVKIEILDRFLSMESSKEYITSSLKVLVK